MMKEDTSRHCELCESSARKLAAAEKRVEELEASEFKAAIESHMLHLSNRLRDALFRIDELEPLVKKAMDFVRWGDDDDPCCCITDDGEECVVCMFNRYFKEHPCEDCVDKQARIDAAGKEARRYEDQMKSLSDLDKKDWPLEECFADIVKILTADNPQPGESEESP
jgi:hypothetical protein